MENELKELKAAAGLYELAVKVKNNRQASEDFLEDSYYKTLQSAEKIRRLLSKAPDTTGLADASVSDDIMHITIPALIPRVKAVKKEKEYFRELLFPVISDLHYYKEPVMIVWVTNYRANASDVDNRDWKIVLDVLNEKLFTDDNPEACSQMFLSKKTDTEKTDIYIMPITRFKEWIHAFEI